MRHMKRLASIFTGKEEQGTRKLNTDNRSESPKRDENEVELLLAANPFSEIQVLAQQSFVTTIVAIDSERIASGLADGTITIWDVVYGIQLHVLEYHNDAINVLSYIHLAASTDFSRLPPQVLLSTSDDGNLALWDVDNGGVPLVTILVGSAAGHVVACHFSGTDALVTGGKTLCAWSFSGQLMACVDTIHDCVKSMLYIGGNFLVVADSSHVDVYEVTYNKEKVDFTLQMKLSTNEQVVTCMGVTADDSFAYGCNGGLLHIRCLPEFDLICEINCAVTATAATLLDPKAASREAQSANDAKTVHSITCSIREFLIAAVGCDIVVVQLLRTPANIVHRCRAAHNGPICYVTVTFGIDMLITCGSDAAIKLWDLSKMVQPQGGMGSALSQHSYDHSVALTSANLLLGECQVHSGSIRMAVAFSDGFVSIADDLCLVIWKDPLRQHMGRRRLLAHAATPAFLRRGQY